MEPVSQVLALELNYPVLGQEPVVPFAILLLVILVVPILFERLRLPGIVGLVFAGLVLGPSGWNLFNAKLPMINLLSNIGLIYLMFVVGLEQELGHLRKNIQRSLGFASFTFFVPCVTGILLGRIFGFGWNTSIFIGSLFASYTLLAYPIISSLGVVKNPAVSATIDATIFTDISTLVVLAVCLVSLQTGVFNLPNLLTLLGHIIIYSVIILVGFDWAGQEFFRRSGDDEGKKFLFVLLAVFVALLGAEFIDIEKILGAFLAGLAVNEVVDEGPTKDKVVFAGSVLFIPIFFINIGLLIDLSAWLRSITTLKLMVLVVVGVIVSKFIAALLAKLFYRYNWQEMLTMWTLSMPQLGTTLAATLVGYRAELISTEVFHSVVGLMLITSTLGPLLTSRLAVSLTPTAILETVQSNLIAQKTEEKQSSFTIVVPIYNPHTQQHLIEMAALLARQAKGKIIPLNIATTTAHMDAPQLEASLQRSERLLAKATVQSRNLGVEAEPLLRIDDAFALGISRAAREQKANLIVMGWGKRTGLRARLFGNVVDSVLWSAHCPVVVTRLVESPHKIQRILVPLENLTSPTLQPVQFAQMLAESNQAQVTVLNVCDRHTSSSKIDSKRSQLAALVSNLALQNSPEVQIIAHENVAQAILQAARLYDLVVLPFIRNRNSPGSLAISDVSTQLARQLTCSVVMLGEPQRTQISINSKKVINTKSVV
ncbi:cation:proton antiporter [Nostoc sp. FACHB-152]|uniref:cation:proton antiporter domain-containing protein n=1 Tax=unclassified Nostoc TaxID=2593658 RepID=UPI001684A2FD|nr:MULTISPECIES: cation:proton antiporter [unclassified Nostoc]MBD2448494.1 cation:proton antiporter [Nostoc sp. FACHB-152]MBD2466231.1 cation:proton antiporter [Nostoc sp. FACHB-145]